MAILYPEICRGVTSGALRQVAQKGGTTASGGLHSTESIRAMVRSINPTDYFNKREPAGEFMETLNKTQTQIDENTDAIQRAAHKLVESAKDANKQMADVTGKFRSGTEHLGVAIDKLMKVAGRSDYEKTVALTKSLVESLERLAVLEEKGMLDKVMKAMR